MTDRLPAPLEELRPARAAERASATPVRSSPRSIATEDEGPVVAPAAATLRAVQGLMVAGISGTEHDANVATTLVKNGPRSSARDRFDIYRYGYRARLVECLVDDYPVISEVLGEERFEALCGAYVERHPSTSPNLNAFGRHLAHFCAEAEERTALTVFGTAALQRFFAELAALEWALVEAIHAAPAPVFDAAAFQAIAPEHLGDARLVASGSARLLRFEHPVNAFYQAVRMSSQSPAIPERAPTAVAIYRRGLTVWRMDLTPAMSRVLGALLDGSTIGESLARIGVDESDPEALAEAERSVMVWFREWVQAGFFSAVRVDA